MTDKNPQSLTTPEGMCANANPPDPSHPNCFNNVSNYQWADAFYNKSVAAFKEIFHPDVTQSASTSPFTNFGYQEVSETFGWASAFYQRCDFTYQASTDLIDFLEWDLTTANNMHITGMTVLTKDASGKVIKVFNGHRNLTEAVIFGEHFVKGPKGKGVISLFHKKALKKYGLAHKFPRNPAGFNGTQSVTAADYIDAFRAGTAKAFADICDERVVLSASYVANTVKGNESVATTMAIVSSFYEHCTFTIQVDCESRSYLLYNGRLRNGLNVSDGFLILVRNHEGKITEVLDNPIPAQAGTLISAYLMAHHPDRSFAEDYFYNERLFNKAVAKYSLDNVYGKNTKDLSSFIKSTIAIFLIEV